MQERSLADVRTILRSERPPRADLPYTTAIIASYRAGLEPREIERLTCASATRVRALLNDAAARVWLIRSGIVPHEGPAAWARFLAREQSGRIEGAALSRRTARALSRAGFQHCEQLAETPDCILLALHNIGRCSLAEIRAAGRNAEAAGLVEHAARGSRTGEARRGAGPSGASRARPGVRIMPLGAGG